MINVVVVLSQSYFSRSHTSIRLCIFAFRSSSGALLYQLEVFAFVLNDVPLFKRDAEGELEEGRVQFLLLQPFISRPPTALPPLPVA
ncbi:hypothetical protein E2C01_006816 [Portunus trituberculatus]|uniref:Uncharacterized protein n=1 Tax=Portunus trituberculatus TaxID=210409 RepID=A0A5B7D2U4_PORTR|nr:hypothetical protein [Portunus trituberculatus]